jgi:hypothetical protein
MYPSTPLRDREEAVGYTSSRVRERGGSSGVIRIRAYANREGAVGLYKFALTRTGREQWGYTSSRLREPGGSSGLQPTELPRFENGL